MNQEQAQRVFNDAHNSLLRLNVSTLKLPIPPAGRLYHYTTVEGLLGIIESKCIHASAAAYLNDASEVAYGCSILAEVLSQIKKNVTSAFARQIFDHLLRSFSSDSDSFFDWPQSVFVTCFCAEDNLLSQWRAYGQSGGYSIEVPISTYRTIRVSPEPKTYTSLLWPVLYDRAEQISSCTKRLNDICQIISNQELAEAQTFSPSSYMEDRVRKVVEDILVEEIVRFKDEAFSEEREWRLVTRVRELLKQGRDDGGKSPTELYFRTSRGFVVPYIKLIPNDNTLPISGIRIGPTTDKKKAKPALAKLLEMNGFAAVQISGSDIPVLI